MNPFEQVEKRLLEVITVDDYHWLYNLTPLENFETTLLALAEQYGVTNDYVSSMQ